MRIKCIIPLCTYCRHELCHKDLCGKYSAPTMHTFFFTTLSDLENASLYTVMHQMTGCLFDTMADGFVLFLFRCRLHNKCTSTKISKSVSSSIQNILRIESVIVHPAFTACRNTLSQTNGHTLNKVHVKNIFVHKLSQGL